MFQEIWLPIKPKILNSRFGFAIEIPETSKPVFEARLDTKGYRDKAKGLFVYEFTNLRRISLKLKAFTAAFHKFENCIHDVTRVYIQTCKIPLRIIQLRPVSKFNLSPDNWLELIKSMFGFSMLMTSET